MSEKGARRRLDRGGVAPEASTQTREEAATEGSRPSEQSNTVVDVRDAFCLHPVPDGAVAALRGLTLAVMAGERVLVHGPNGSGKTTLLRVLSGEQRLSAGHALVAGLDPAAAGPAGLARWRSTRIGWIDQHPARMLRPELDVLDNVALQQRLAGIPTGDARERGTELLDRLGVRHLAVRRPGQLSGGEAQRVALCAALAHRPQLVLADEPSGELDARSALEVYDALAEAVLAVGAALVLVSHDRSAARVADRVVRIRDGRLSETWQPVPSGEAGPDELLVVDDRGWLRLPEPLRRASGAGDAVTARLDGNAIVLRPPGDGPGAVACPEPDRLDRVEPQRGVTPGVPVAQLVGVSRRYGDRTVLSGLDLDVMPGQVLVIRGRSGAGKSTLLRILTGLDSPDSGEVALAGQPLNGLDRSGRARLRGRVAAVVGQDVHLAETSTVLVNLELARAVRALPPDPDGDRGLVEELGLAALARREVRLLSGGERQRVAVARALAVRPALVVLDEPSSQLDESSAEQLAGVLRRAASGGAAVVVASHDPVLVDAADAILDLEPVPLGSVPAGSYAQPR